MKRSPESSPSDSSRPAKKQAAQSDSVAVKTQADDGTQAIRDGKYYFEDGDIVIRVGNTLFKVHRFMLSRDSMIFQDMFNAHVCSESGATQLDDSDDNRPLVLVGDSIGAFRCLLGILYMRPIELLEWANTWKQENSLDDLLTLAEISSKYLVISIWNLVMKTLSQYVENFTEHLSKTAPAYILEYAIKLARAGNMQNTQKNLVRIFVTRVLVNGIPPQDALEFGNTHSLRLLQGGAHYALLMSIQQSRAENLGATKFGKDQGWDEELRLRIMHGHYSLLQTCARLCKVPPLSLEVCRDLGVERWYKGYKVQYEVGSVDALSLLSTIRDELEEKVRNGKLAAEKLSSVIQEFRDNLMDHFEI